MEFLNPDVIKIISETWLTTLLAILYFVDVRETKKVVTDMSKKLDYIEKGIDKKDSNLDDIIKLTTLLNKKKEE